MAQFEVLVYNEELAYWFRNHGVNKTWVKNWLDRDAIFTMTAQDFKVMALMCYVHMSNKAIEEFETCYGKCESEQMIIHIADEILASCCRTVLQ